MFIGGLGKERTFIVIDRSAKLKLPSDLVGITPDTFEPPQRGKMQASVGKACYEIEQAIKNLGVKQPDSNLDKDNNQDLNNSKLIITNYLSKNGYKMISFDRLFSMNKKFTRTYVETLMNTFPGHFSIAFLKNEKPGISLNE